MMWDDMVHATGIVVKTILVTVLNDISLFLYMYVSKLYRYTVVEWQTFTNKRNF